MARNRKVCWSRVAPMERTAHDEMRFYFCRWSLFPSHANKQPQFDGTKSVEASIFSLLFFYCWKRSSRLQFVCSRERQKRIRWIFFFFDLSTGKKWLHACNGFSLLLRVLFRPTERSSRITFVCFSFRLLLETNGRNCSHCQLWLELLSHCESKYCFPHFRSLSVISNLIARNVWSWWKMCRRTQNIYDFGNVFFFFFDDFRLKSARDIVHNKSVCNWNNCYFVTVYRDHRMSSSIVGLVFMHWANANTACIRQFLLSTFWISRFSIDRMRRTRTD